LVNTDTDADSFSSVMVLVKTELNCIDRSPIQDNLAIQNTSLKKQSLNQSFFSKSHASTSSKIPSTSSDKITLTEIKNKPTKAANKALISIVWFSFYQNHYQTKTIGISINIY
jgi:hypothetical protein